MWSFERDKDLLAGKATDEVVSVIMKFNSYMALNSKTCSGKADLLHTIDFLEMCKGKINEAIDEKIEVLKEGSK